MIIGLSGKIASGKTTVADYLVEGYGFTKVAFADALKKTMMDLFELSYNQVYNLEEKGIIDPRYNKTPREIMQIFGTECVRQKILHDFWVMKLQWFIEKNKHNNIVVEDVRFDNEAEMVRTMGGIVIVLVRQNNPYDNVEGANHASEERIKININDYELCSDSVGETIVRIDRIMQSIEVGE